jgi:hypothetical protein
MSLQEIYAAMKIVGRDGLRLDANETSMLNRQLEFVRSKTYEKLYAKYLARSFIPQATDIPSWTPTVVEVLYDSFGMAKVISNNAASRDLPRADTIVSEASFKVASLGSSYGFNQMELRAAAATGAPLESRRASAARRSIEGAIDALLFKGTIPGAGQLNLGFTGIANNANVPGLTPFGAGASWTGATAAEMFKDLNQMITVPEQTTEQLFRPDTILLAPREYDLVATTPFNSFTADTVLTVFLRANPGVSVLKWHRLKDSVSAGTNRCISYVRDPDVIESIIPQDFEQFPAQIAGLEMVIPCHARCGGVHIHQPKACAYLDLDASSV